jgi:CHAT domain-containing protein
VALGGVEYSRSGKPAGPDQAAFEHPVLRGGPFAGGFPPLPGSRAEVEALARLLGDRVELITGPEATVEALEAAGQRARWLHVATHGWFSPDTVRSARDSAPVDAQLAQVSGMSALEAVRDLSPMLLCGLALAGVNAPSSSESPGLVTAEELSTWDLADCELAVLSACETNVGVVRAGRGVASLQKALHAAGARSVITSLWKVPDEATAELMTAFYRLHLIEGVGRAEALRAAKADLRERVDTAGRPAYSPRDWAGWVLTGEAR